MPADQLAEILEPFRRLEGSRNRETGGAGLGLSIAKSIAEAHGGMLRLEANVPRGLRAVIGLPRE